MVCERCHKNIARLTVTIKTKDGSRQAHLCPMCALTLPVFYAPTRHQVRTDKHCPFCQLRLSEFSKDGRLGCPHCYETFELELADVLNRVQGTDTHVSIDTKTRPPTAPSSDDMAKHNRIKIPDVEGDARIDQLKTQLKEAVAAEDYHLAASLRDEIRNKEENDDLV